MSDARGKSDLRNPWLDVLRGLAALAVTFFHLNEPIPAVANRYREIVKLGWLGVPVFFVMSGFVVHTAAVRSASAKQYAWRRLTRIFPPYWASLLLTLGIAASRKLFTGANDVTPIPRSVGGWLATLTAMTAPATSTQTMNWVYWTLTFELVFYAVTAIAVISPRWFPQVAIALAILSVLPGGLSITSYAGLFFLSHWAVFGLGVGLSLASQKRRVASAAVLLVCGIVVFLNSSIEMAVVSCATVAFIALSNRLPRGGFHGPLVKLGEMSYSLYLIHVPVGCYLLLQWKSGVWAEDPLWNLAYDCAAVVGCVVVAWVFFRLIERPSIELGRRPVPFSAKLPG